MKMKFDALVIIDYICAKIESLARLEKIDNELKVNSGYF